MAASNQFGQLFKVSTFGESHGDALGCVIDGCPAGVEFSVSRVQAELDRRRPGQAAWVSQRNEPDEVEVLSGVYQGKTLGTPIAMLVRNRDARSGDYKHLDETVKTGGVARVGHADDVWLKKFGHVDTRGGGRASGRETVARVMAGAVAHMTVEAMAKHDARTVGFHPIEVSGYASQIGPFNLTEDEREHARKMMIAKQIDGFAARFPSQTQSAAVEKLLVDAVKEGRSFGGAAEIVIRGAPVGLGQPVFHKLKADLAAAYFGVGATASVEIGDGNLATAREGTDFHSGNQTSVYGGIRGGLATGEPILARVGFKPTSTVMDLAKRGRHDPCIVPRALPVLEAMTWLVLCDHMLAQRLDRA